jgi:peptidoglycan-associated lipoprotein
MMRIPLPAILLFSALLAACASDKDVLAAKDIPQSGTLKVHPGLLGAPVAPQAPAKTDSIQAPAEQPGTR